MAKQDEMLAEALQAIEREVAGDGGLVTSFVAIAEIALPDDADATGYRIFCQGSPALQQGLVEYLRNNTREEIHDRREPDDD